MYPPGEALLDELLAGAPPAEGAAEGAPIDTAAVIHRFALHVRDLAAVRPDLTALCRKLEVGGAVKASYGPGWKRIPRAPELDARWRTLFAAALLALADHHLGAPDEDTRGAALKSLNAALKAVERLADGAPDHVARLSAWSEQLLRTVATGAPR